MMATAKPFIRAGNIPAVMLAACCLAARLASADTVNANYNSAADVPVTADGYTATGSTVNFTLNFAPATGTDLTVVSNTGLGFIAGTFDNLAQGQPVVLSYAGTNYLFVANYYGGSGNDLVLVWANTRAFGWGSDGIGQLGDNSITFARYTPVPVNITASPAALLGKTVVGLAAGFTPSLALCADGAVRSWGGNAYGELGLGGTDQRSYAVPMPVSTAAGVSALYGKTVVGIAAGAYHCLALCSDGTVAAWGFNAYGELGYNGNHTTVPVSVNATSGVSALYGKTVVAIAAGTDHNLALCSDGTLAAWGYNNNGQLGDNTTTNRNVPVVVNADPGISALFGKAVVAIAAGSNYSLALCSDGTVAAWGANGSGQLGDNTTTNHSVPVAVNTNSGPSALYGRTVRAIAAGGSHALALCSDGTVVAWGANANGQLGDTTGIIRLAPVAVNTNSGVSALYNKSVVAIAAGSLHSLALCSDGTAVAWGYNNHGEIGDNTQVNRLAPVVVNRTALAASQRFTRVCSGSFALHSLALVAAPPATDINLTDVQTLANRAIQFVFTNTPGAFFGVLAATNPALPLGNWTSLTGLTEATPGQFQFTDPQATNTPQRFYRVRSP